MDYKAFVVVTIVTGSIVLAVSRGFLFNVGLTVEALQRQSDLGLLLILMQPVWIVCMCLLWYRVECTRAETGKFFRKRILDEQQEWRRVMGEENEQDDYFRNL